MQFWRVSRFGELERFLKSRLEVYALNFFFLLKTGFSGFDSVMVHDLALERSES